MSGTSFGTVVLHVSPESAIGGPLAVVRNRRRNRTRCGRRAQLEPVRSRRRDRPAARSFQQPAPHVRPRLRQALPGPRHAGQPGLRFRFPAQSLNALAHRIAAEFPKGVGGDPSGGLGIDRADLLRRADCGLVQRGAAFANLAERPVDGFANEVTLIGRAALQVRTGNFSSLSSLAPLSCTASWVIRT